MLLCNKRFSKPHVRDKTPTHVTLTKSKYVQAGVHALYNGGTSNLCNLLGTKAQVDISYLTEQI